MSKVINFRVDDEHYARLAKLAEQQDESVGAIAKRRALRVIGVTDDSRTRSTELMLTPEEDERLVAFCRETGQSAWELLRDLVLEEIQTWENSVQMSSSKSSDDSPSNVRELPVKPA